MLQLHRAGLAALMAAAIQSATAHAQTPSTPQAPVAAIPSAGPADVVIPDTRRVAFVSTVNGRAYAIDVAFPFAPPPPGGYPVFYVLDGEGYFASVVEAARANGNAPQAIVVGIGYPIGDPAWRAGVLSKMKVLPAGLSPGRAAIMALSLERIRDFTTAPDADTLKQAAAQGVTASPDDFGGVDGFLKTIEVDIKPRVQAMLAESHRTVNLKDQTLFGHSLGGLAVVEALFTEPDAYRTFVAASPSIWFADRAVLAKEAAFAAKVGAGKATPRILITVGAEEQTPPQLPAAMAAHQAEVDADIAKDRMVGNACDLAGRLKALHGAEGYQVADCAVFPHQQHGISVWPAIGQAIAFAYPH
jgi:uncharacterized protein